MGQQLRALIAVSALAAAPALAGDSGFGVQAMTGWTSRWADNVYYKTAPTWGLGVSYAPMQKLSVVGEVSYSRLPMNPDRYGPTHPWATNGGASLYLSDVRAATMWSAGLHVKMRAHRRTTAVAPYLRTGLDVCNMSHDLTAVEVDFDSRAKQMQYRSWRRVLSEHALWAAIGTGVDVRMSRNVGLFVEALARVSVTDWGDAWDYINPGFELAPALSSHGAIRIGVSLGL